MCKRKKIVEGISVGIKASAIVTVFVIIPLLLLVEPSNCYYEHGTEIQTWHSQGYYWLQFESREANRTRVVYFNDGFPEVIHDPSKATILYQINVYHGEDIALKWCFIPLIQKDRIRGAWKWEKP